MSTAAPKSAIYQSLALVAKALAHPHRLALLEHVAQGERAVEALAAVSGLPVANASQHLLQLRRAGLLVSRRDGKRVLYRLSDNGVFDLLAALRGVTERNVAEAQQAIAHYFTARDQMQPVTRTELLRRLRQKSVTVLDVRPQDEFAMGHLPGAINLPLKDMARRLKSLPQGQEIIAYCRGPYCVLSFEAVALLRTRGFTARRLEDGFPEWQAAGLTVQH